MAAVEFFNKYDTTEKIKENLAELERELAGISEAIDKRMKSEEGSLLTYTGRIIICKGHQKKKKNPHFYKLGFFPLYFYLFFFALTGGTYAQKPHRQLPVSTKSILFWAKTAR